MLPATGIGDLTWLTILVAWFVLSIGVALIFSATCKKRDRL